MNIDWTETQPCTLCQRPAPLSTVFNHTTFARMEQIAKMRPEALGPISEPIIVKVFWCFDCDERMNFQVPNV